ncbi:MAG: flagellar hook-length control protein FliK [Labrys sp. (in: a-proteobacteria)]
MPIDPVQSAAASALRLETEGAAGLVRLLAGESLQATVVAALRNGGLRLALVDILFQGDRAIKAPATGTPPPTARPAQIDLPAIPGLRVGDTVRLTITETAPAIVVRIEPTTPDNGQAPTATTLVVGSASRRDAAGAAPLPPATGGQPLASPQPGTASVTVRDVPTIPVRDSITLSPEAALALLASEGEPEVAAQASPTRIMSAEARSALAAMIPRAAAHQTSLAPLFAQATALVEDPVFKTMPAPVRTAIETLAREGGIEPATLDAATLRQAIERAGPFFEAGLASLAVPGQGQNPASTHGDLKGMLLALRGLLRDVLGQAAPEPASGDRPAPPRRGLPPLGQPASPLPDMIEDPATATRRLAGAVDGALDRIRLQQAAALPDDPGRGPTRPDAMPVDRLLELPLRLPGETPILGLSVGPDGRAQKPGEPRGWRMRLSLDLADTGRIDGLVAVRGRLTTVHLSASRPETAALLRDHLPALRDALIAADLDVEGLDLSEATPPAPEPVRSGSFLDRRS